MAIWKQHCRARIAKGGRPPYDAVLMFKVLVLQTLYTLSDEQSEYRVKDRLSFMSWRPKTMLGLTHSATRAPPGQVSLGRRVIGT